MLAGHSSRLLARIGMGDSSWTRDTEFVSYLHTHPNIACHKWQRPSRGHCQCAIVDYAAKTLASGQYSIRWRIGTQETQIYHSEDDPESGSGRNAGKEDRKGQNDNVALQFARNILRFDSDCVGHHNTASCTNSTQCYVLSSTKKRCKLIRDHYKIFGCA